ncbi:MAG: hypothetical protein ACI9XO_003955 [Paraglaciecola sp.]
MTKFKKRGLIFFLVIGVLTLLLFLAGNFFGQKFEVQVRTAMNNVFEPQIDELNVDFSFLRHFPHPSMWITDLQLVAHRGDTLRDILSLDKAEFQFDIYKFIKGDFSLRVVKISNGELLFYTNEKGENIRPFQYNEVEEAKKKQKFELAFPKIEVENIIVRGDNRFKNAQWKVSAKSADLKGELIGTRIFLEGDVHAVLDTFQKDGRVILKELSIDIHTQFKLDNEAKVSTFTDARLKIENAEFEGNGTITTQYPVGSILDIKLAGKDGFQSILGLLPEEYLAKFKQTNPDAKFDTQLHINGLGGPKHSSKIDISVIAENAKVEMTEYPVVLENVNFAVSYTTGDLISRVDNHLVVKDLSAMLNGRPILINADLINLDTLQITLDFDLNIDLNDFYKIIPIAGVDEVGGILKLKGNYEAKDRLLENRLPKLNLDGSISLNDNLLSVGGKKFKNLNGKVLIKNDRLTFNSINGTFSSIPFELSGKADNTYRFLLDIKENVIAKVDIKCESIYLNSVFQSLSNKGKNTQKKKKTTEHPLDFPDYLRGDMQISASKMYYKDVIAKRVRAKFSLSKNQINIPYLKMDILDGKFGLNGRFVKNKRDNFTLYSNVNIVRINTKTLLELFNNFEQEVLTSKQIEGRLTADLKLAGELDKELQFLENDFSYRADFTLDDAELNNFEPLTKAFTFLKKEEAANLIIKDLKGQAIYHRNQLLIPNLEFNSNISYITFFGKRQADEYMKFHAEVSLADLLFKSKKRKLAELLGKRKSQRGKMNARVEISGKPYQLGVKPNSKDTWLDTKREVTRQYNRKKRSYFTW